MHFVMAMGFSYMEHFKTSESLLVMLRSEIQNISSIILAMSSLIVVIYFIILPYPPLLPLICIKSNIFVMKITFVLSPIFTEMTSMVNYKWRKYKLDRKYLVKVRIWLTHIGRPHVTTNACAIDVQIAWYFPGTIQHIHTFVSLQPLSFLTAKWYIVDLLNPDLSFRDIFILTCSCGLLLSFLVLIAFNN